MNKNKTNLSVVNNIGVRVKPSIIVGEQGSYSSGDILDANAVEKVVKNKVNDVIGDAADALDTLEELGRALPTKLSQLQNDVPYVTEDDLKVEVVDANGHEYVDLGLPSGILWATMNVGASSPEDYGDYFAWGEIEPKEVYSLDTYDPLGDGTGTYDELGDDISGTDHDVARMKWGGQWVMPTYDEIVELLGNTTSEWTTLNGVNGRKLTGRNGNMLFLPAAGGRWQSSASSPAGLYGKYWQSTIDKWEPSEALRLSIDSTGWSLDSYTRLGGLSVRPVIKCSLVDKYATKQELNAETQRAQTVEATKANTADLATVATTGSYNDLTDKPVIPDAQIQADWNQTNTSSKDYIKNKPTNVSSFNNDSGYLTQHQDLSNYATHQDVSQEVADLVDSAPSTLDTLNELAEALGNDPNFATTVATQIGLKYTKPSTGIPSTDLDSATQTSLSKADSALQSETDPTVPAWAKTANKPTYTYSEVGAADSQLVFGTNFRQSPIFPYIHIMNSGNILIQDRAAYGGGETIYLTYEFPMPEQLYDHKVVRVAGLASPALEGTPTAPTATTGTNTTQIATTAFVQQETTNMVESSTVRNVVVLTQAEYDALTTLDPNTEYNIIETV